MIFIYIRKVKKLHYTKYFKKANKKKYFKILNYDIFKII